MTDIAFVSPCFVAVAPLHLRPHPRPCCTRRRRHNVSSPRAVAEVYDAVAPSAPIIVGAVALASPFFIAAVLFGERIVRQRACKRCSGSGLVQNGPRYYRKCPEYVVPSPPPVPLYVSSLLIVRPFLPTHHPLSSFVPLLSCGGFLPWQSWRRFFTG